VIIKLKSQSEKLHEGFESRLSNKQDTKLDYQQKTIFDLLVDDIYNDKILVSIHTIFYSKSILE
jgi:hypothetical protein